jgi:hypothetical protein
MTANYAIRLLLLAALYVIAGRGGLLLAVPPGYATIIWPASGIAVGMLMVADSSATREKGGTGLGLHISQRFMERMNGKIGFESEPGAGAGATFWTELPVVR